jgi:hypothetical protein
VSGFADSFLASSSGVLQLLSSSSSSLSSSSAINSNQKYLVPVLGKRSGYDDTASTGTYLSKKEESAKLGFGWIRPSPGVFTCPADLELLPECCTYISLRLQHIVPAGDHGVALCEVVDTAVWNPEAKTAVSCANVVDAPQVFGPSSALYTGQLREEEIGQKIGIAVKRRRQQQQQQSQVAAKEKSISPRIKSDRFMANPTRSTFKLERSLTWERAILSTL